MTSDKLNAPRIANAPFDKPDAIARLGSESLLKKVAFMFLANNPGMMKEIGDAVGRGDWQALERSAHTLVSSMAYFSAPAASRAALALETIGRERRPGAAEAYQALRDEVGRLKLALAELLPEEGRPRES